MSRALRSLLAGSVVAFAAAEAHAQMTDQVQAPDAAHAGIKKSYAQEIGADRGDVDTPDSSAFVIARDPFRAIRRGRQLFQRKFTMAEGLGPRTNARTGRSAPASPTAAPPATAGRSARPARAATSSRARPAATRPTSSGSA